jgi:transposase
MSKALSVDLRERVVGAVEGGASRREAAERFGVSASSAVRWKKRESETGSVAPKALGGDRRSGKIEAHAGWLKAFVEKHHDATLEEIGAALKTEKGHSAGVSTLWRFFDRHAITLKKSRRMPPSRRGPTS